MITQQTQRLIGLLADDMAGMFTPPEYIPGCKVKSIADKDQYATDNGWVEALCGRHNQQRCRWFGQIPSVAVDDFIDVVYYPSYATFIVAGQGGGGAAATGNYLVTDGTRTGATSQAQDFGANGIEADALDSSSAAGIAVADDLDMDAGTDVYPGGDVAGVKRRSIDIYQSNITDHFDAGTFSGFTWATYAGYITPAGIDVTTYPSHANIYLSGGQTVPSEAFAYRGTVSTPIYARCTTGDRSRAGLRFDDGTNSKYTMLFLEHNTGTNLLDLKYETDLAGATLVSGLPPMQYVLQLGFNGTTGFFYYGTNAIQTLFVGSASTTFTAARSGIYYSQRAAVNNAVRANMIDWYKQ